MLKVFRHKGVAKKVLWVVSGIIIISFGFGFGMSRYGSSFNVNQTAGKIYGKTISLKEYNRHFKNTHDQAVMMHGADLEKAMPMMDLDNETWTRIMLLKEAETRGLKASDMEVIQFVSTIAFFQRDGEFDKRLYANIVNNVFKRDPREFEEGLRDQIKIMKLFTPQLKAINFTDDAVRKEYEHRNQKVQVSFVLVAPEALASGITVEEKELKAYFDTHREEFLEPEATSATVVTLPVSEKATDKEKSAASDKADELYKKLNAGADIAAAAKEFSATVKNTGLFNIEAPSPALSSLEMLQQVFTAKNGDILGPVKSPEGYQIVKIVDKEPALTPEFDKIKDKVKAAVIKNKTSEIAAKKAAELQKTLADKIKAGADFTTSTKELGLEAKQTAFFGMGEYIPEVGLSNDFISTAFTLGKDNRLSQVVITPRGPAILYWTATQPIDEKKFEEVKKDFAESLYAEARMHVMNEVIGSLREKAKIEDYLAQIKAKQDAEREKMRVKN
jgi:parvulin-like peptidyl-prolyl isomerase